MPGKEKAIEWVRVRYGNRIYRAKRFDTGSWWIEDESGFHFMTLNHNDFLAQFEKVPADA